MKTKKLHQSHNHNHNALPGVHGPGHETLDGNLSLLEVLGRGVLNLELSHGITEGLLNLLLLAALQLHGQTWVRDLLLDTRDV